jgi:uncharacterized membrane protein (UPF0127 family)
MSKLINERTGKTIADVVEVADTRATRRRGLLGRDHLPAGRALMLTPCNAIHTFRMRFPIDVAFVDKRGRVRRIVRELGPSRIKICVQARATIEFASGQLDESLIQIGDSVKVIS